MTPEQIEQLREILFTAISIETIFITGLIWECIWTHIVIAMYPSPEVIYYMQNCDNITLYPQGCQVLS